MKRLSEAFSSCFVRCFQYFRGKNIKTMQTLLHNLIFLNYIFHNFLTIIQKCSKDVVDVDFTVGCDSASPHPARCPD